MKKRFIPTLMLLSFMSLTACGGDNSGFVKNGVAYKNGDAAQINADVKAAKENKVRTVREDLNMDLYMKISYNGQSSTIKEKMSGFLDVDIDAKTIVGKFDISASVDSTKQSSRLDFKAEEQNGEFVLTKGADAAESFDSEKLASLYEKASVNIYSWNYSSDTDDISSIISQSGTSSLSEAEATALLKKLYANIVVSGDFTTGTFEIGLGKSMKITVGGYPFTFTKLKTAYEDGLMKSTVAGLSLNYKQSANGQTASISFKESVDYNFSYTFR